LRVSLELSDTLPLTDCGKARVATTSAQASARSFPAVSRRPGTKLAALVADHIVADIIQAGWPEGSVLGSEVELVERYGVSRAVFREAVRLLEHQQVARMRRGPGGGLVVTAPTLEAVIDPVAVYLFYANASISNVAEARIVLEETVAELAPARMSEDDIAALRALADRERTGVQRDHRELHAMLASITRNPAIEAFAGLLNRLMYLYFPDIKRVRPATAATTNRAHVAIIEAVLAGDQGRTRHRMRRHLEAEADYLARRLRSQRRLDASVLRSLDGSKRGEVVARDIFVGVSEAGWPVDELIGSEAELMERYDVSRAVLREAVRLLEHHHVATMRRGPGGGLFVAQPGVDSATEALALLLERRGIKPDDLFEPRIALELAIVELAIARLTDEDIAALHAVLAAEEQAPSEAVPFVGHDIHAVLAAIVGNPVIELLSLVLIRLTHMHLQVTPGAEPPRRGHVHKAHRAIVEAVVDRDVELARHRMHRHLAALRTWVQ
jgi:DNA-binding FadR family transcriptional regulator